MAKRKRLAIPSYAGFRAFLQDEHCEEAFDRNFAASHPGYRMDETLWHLLGLDSEFLFGRVFPWDQTPEGRLYWSGVDRDWRNLVWQA